VTEDYRLAENMGWSKLTSGRLNWF